MAALAPELQGCPLDIQPAEESISSPRLGPGSRVVSAAQIPGENLEGWPGCKYH